MTEVLEALPLASLPALKQPLEGGIFCGVITLPDGKHYAVTWLDKEKPPKCNTFAKQMAWAKSIGAQLVTRAIASMLVANVGDLLPSEAVWTCEEYGSAYAWYCSLSYGGVFIHARSAERGAVAVRLIPLTS